MQDREYQTEAIAKTLLGFKEFRRQLGVCPTGGGKTIIFAKIAQAVLSGALGESGDRTLIFAHREELIEQAVAKIFATTGIFPSVEKAENRGSFSSEVVVASIQTMQRRYERWAADHFKLIVCDEAHHSISKSWQEPLNYFAPACVLGVTATPDRGDKKNLGSYYENIAFEITLFDLIRKGYLSPIKVKALPLKIDLGQVRTTAGDYNDADLGDALAPYLKEIAAQLGQQAANRKTLVFVPLIATSKAFIDICRGLGLRAEHIDGNSPDRKEILKRYARGEFDLLSNAMLLTEGYDEPSINCVVILRPTQSRPLYSQMVGRGTRIAPGKSDLLLLDFLWLHERHNLIRPAHLIATCDEHAAAMTAMTEAAAYGQDEFDLEVLDGAAREQRETKLRDELAAKAKRSAKFVDALDYCLQIGDLEAAEYEPTMGWHRKPVTEGQSGALTKAGIDIASVQSRGHASALLETIFNRRKLNMATPKQVKWMRHFGHEHPEKVTFNEASAYLDQMFARGKKETRDLVPF